MNRRLERLLLALILGGHLLLTFGYSVINPLGEAPDEADHWAYIVYLANEHRLPIGPKVTQSKHPPFYHATAALIASLADPRNDFLRSNPDVAFASQPGWSPNFFIHGPMEEWPWRGGVLAFHLVRLWSVLLSTLTVAATYGLARQALPQQRAVALTAAAVLAFLPEFVFIGGAVNNDSAAALFGTLALWGAFAHLHRGGHYRPGWWSPLALGLGLLAKTSTLALWPVVGLAIVAGTVDLVHGENTLPMMARQIMIKWRIWLRTALVVFIPAILIASPWLVRNWQLYGDPLGMALVRQTIDQRTTVWTWGDTLWLVQGWFNSFWGKFGGAGHIPMPSWIYGGLLGLTLCSVVGLLRCFFRSPLCGLRSTFLLLSAALLSTALVVWQYSLIALGTDQGRLLYPAVAAIVVLWVAGLLNWFPQRHRGKGALVLVVLLGCLGLYGLLGVIQSAFAPPAPVSTLEWQSAAMEPAIQWGELALIGWELDVAPVLYWRSAMTPTQDWRVILRIVASDGTLIWEWRRSPGAGRWRTDRWPADVVVRDQYAIRWPDWAAPGHYRVEVALQPNGEEPLLPTRAGDEAMPSEHPFIYLGDIYLGE